MIKLLLLFTIFPLILFGQISFIKEHKTHAYFDEGAIPRPYELSNGNFVCAVLLGDNNVWYNMIYLFDECGELSQQLLVSTPDEYMLINNFVELDSSSFLASGYVYDSVLHTVYLVLDNQTLSIKQKRTNFEEGAWRFDQSVLEGDIFYQAGVSGSLVVSSYMNKKLRRNFHLYRDLDDPITYSPVLWMKYKNGRLYTLETREDELTGHEYSVVRCMDKKLRDVYVINGITDTSFVNIDYTIGFLHSDTLLLGTYEFFTNGGNDHRFIRKYYRDSLIYIREAEANNEFQQFTTCEYKDGILKCVNYNGEIGWFSSSGDLFYYSDHLVPLLNEGDMVKMITTNDGGLFSAAYDYKTIDGQGEHLLKIIKTTADYQIAEKPLPKCIVGTTEVLSDYSVSLFPNPASGFIQIESNELVHGYKVYNAVSTLISEGKPIAEKFTIEFQLSPGAYVIVLEFEKGNYSQRFLIVK